MSDLLSAASLLLAIIGVLYGVWFNDIFSATKTKVPKFKEDREKPLLQINSVIFGRALPLAIASILHAAIFLPDTIKIVIDSWHGYMTNFFGNLKCYSAVHTAFCFVIILSIAIAIQSIGLSIKLLLLRHKLKKN